MTVIDKDDVVRRQTVEYGEIQFLERDAMNRVANPVDFHARKRIDRNDLCFQSMVVDRLPDKFRRVTRPDLEEHAGIFLRCEGVETDCVEPRDPRIQPMRLGVITARLERDHSQLLLEARKRSQQI